jgi:hypothetical protein
MKGRANEMGKEVHSSAKRERIRATETAIDVSLIRPGSSETKKTIYNKDLDTEIVILVS